MKKCKKLLKFFSFFATLTLAFLLVSPKANAMYDENLNKVVYGSIKMNPNNNEFTLKVQYQYQVKGVQVYICEAGKSNFSCENEYISLLKEMVDYSDSNKGLRESSINKGGQETLTYLFEPSAVYDGTRIDDYANGTYKIMVKASFCLLRDNELKNCAVWQTNDEDQSYPVIYEETITINSAYTDNTKINQTIDSILHIVNSYAIPVMWVLLGILLVVRGVLLAIDIVKASDEAEVRQKKISGLVWLIIGVFAGYAITIAAHVVMSILGYGGIFS